MAQYTIQVPITRSTYIDRSNPNTNYSSATMLRGGGYNEVDGLWRYYTFIDWDHSLIPQNKKYLSIKLWMYSLKNVPPSTNGYENDIDIGLAKASWDESTLVYANLDPQVDLHFGFYSGRVQSIIANSYISLSIQEKILHGPYGAIVFISSFGGDYFECSSKNASNKPYFEITYEDVPPNAPTPKEPIGAYKDSKGIIRFEWKYNSDVGGTQKAFDLQWSADQANWATVSETTPNNYYDMPAYTLPGGNIYWRVRCYNEYDEVGEYCLPQSFYSIGAPDTPAISAIPTGAPRPTISWSAFNQQVYQLQILQDDNIVYDSGDQPSINARQHKVTAFLADGEYTARLRIKNEYDLWSSWGETAFTVTTIKPDKPTLTLQPSAYGAELNLSAPPNDGYTLIYRSEYTKDDYICIGKTTGTTYKDNAVRNSAEYKYFARTVAADETYQDSDIKFIQASFKHSLIAPVADLTNVFAFTKSLNAPPKRTYNRNISSASVYYAGRMYPVEEPTEHIAAGMSFTFFLRTWEDVERFIEIYDLRGTVLYRDAKGRKIYGTLGNLTVTDEWTGYIVSFAISQVDYNESVEV